MFAAHRAALALAILLAATVLAGCPGGTEDVRIALCKDMTTVELGTEPGWRGNEIQLRGYEDAVIRVRFATSAGEGRAECHYPHLKGDDTGLTLANPIEAYTTSPARLVLDGRTVTGAELARTLELALKRQAREFITRVKSATGSN